MSEESDADLRKELLSLKKRRDNLIQAIDSIRNTVSICVVSREMDRSWAERQRMRSEWERELEGVNKRIREIMRLLQERHYVDPIERAYKKGRADALSLPYEEEEENPIQKGKEYFEKAMDECNKQRKDALDALEAEKQTLRAQLDKLREKEEAVEREHQLGVENVKNFAISKYGYFYMGGVPSLFGGFPQGGFSFG